MRKRSGIRAGVLALCAAFVLSLPVRALPPDHDASRRGGKGEQMEARMKKIHEQLGLTPEQEKRLQDHRKAHREEAKALRKEMWQKKEALRNELEKPDFSLDRVKQIQAELKDVQNRLADHRLEGILEVRRILTPEQFKKFHEATHREWKGKGKGKRKGHHRGEFRHEGAPSE